MTERNSESSCARANELVEFLYQETSEREALEFELHLRNCAECSTELVEFRQMREFIGAWRDECLGVVLPGVVRGSAVEVSNVFEPVPQDNRSAIAAIRQFLVFSPVWMKGAVAFASVLFCVIAALAVQHLLEKSQPAMVTEKLYTERELKAKIEEQMQSLAPLDGRKDEGGPDLIVKRTEKPRAGNRKSTRRFSEASQDSRGTRQRPLTKSEREQLAADLRLTSPEDEEALDLLDDRLSN